MTDIISNARIPAVRVTVPIKIEMNDDTSNIKGDINSETKSREMTKKHFTKQTSRPSSPQQTVTHNEQQERAEAKIINTEEVNSPEIRLFKVSVSSFICRILEPHRWPVILSTPGGFPSQ